MRLLPIDCLAGLVAERVYIQTDKTLYLAGEKMLVKVYDVDLSCKKQDLSHICYIELVDREGAKLQEKLKLDQGTGYASLDIPFSIPTGSMSWLLIPGGCVMKVNLSSFVNL